MEKKVANIIWNEVVAIAKRILGLEEASFEVLVERLEKLKEDPVVKRYIKKEEGLIDIEIIFRSVEGREADSVEWEGSLSVPITTKIETKEEKIKEEIKEGKGEEEKTNADINIAELFKDVPIENGSEVKGEDYNFEVDLKEEASKEENIGLITSIDSILNDEVFREEALELASQEGDQNKEESDEELEQEEEATRIDLKPISEEDILSKLDQELNFSFNLEEEPSKNRKR